MTGTRRFEITSVVHARSAYHAQVESRPGVQGFKVAAFPADGNLEVNASTGSPCTIEARLPKGMLTNYTITCPSPQVDRPALIATSHDGDRVVQVVMNLAEGRY